MDYNNDLPISNTSEDLLNRADFVHQLSAMLKQQLNRRSITIGVYGAWGYGKTSILNLTRSELKDAAVIVDFNPWAFGSQALALKEFLGTLAAAIQESSTVDSNRSKWYWKIPVMGRFLRKRTCNGIFSLRESFGGTLSLYADLAIDITAKLSNTQALTLLKKRTHLLNHSGHLSSMKQKLEAAILSCTHPIIVFIDDIDRLDKEEIFNMFKVVKSILNFTGITYVFAFDDYAVSKALNSRFEDGESSDAGRKYLEKIIQVPLRIPALRREDLDKMLMGAITVLLHDNEISLEVGEGERFRQMYDESFCKFFDTPRSINRYLNALKFLLPSVKGEVNIVDFLILEIVRIFQPEVYASVFNEKELLSGPSREAFISGLCGINPCDKAKDKFSDNDLVWLQRLFPRISDSGDQQAISSKYSTLQKRVCLPDYFDKYFIYGVPTDSISDNIVFSLVKLDNVLELDAGLSLLLANPENQDAALRKIKDNITLCANPEKMAFAILRQFDILCPEAIQFNLPILQTASQLVVDLVLHTLNPSLPLAKIIRECDNPEYLFYLIRSMHLFLSSKKNKARFPELWEYLQLIIANKIQTVASSGVLHGQDHPHGHLLYKYWADVASRETTNRYLQENLKTADDVLDFLMCYLAIWQGGGESVRGDLEKETFDSIEHVAESGWLYSLLASAYPQYSDGCKYVSFSNFDEKFRALGRENTKEFRDILACQFMALAQNQAITEDT